MGKGAEDAARTVSGLLDIVALGRLVDLRVELLLGACVAVLAVIAGLAVARFSPFLAVLDIGARSGPKTMVYRGLKLTLGWIQE